MPSADPSTESSDTQLKNHKPSDEIAPPPSFESLGIAPPILSALNAMGFTQPTEVQVHTIPLAIAGRDLVVQSRTGTGKTAAFMIPLCQSIIDGEMKAVQALVLEPTRELALQVQEECNRIAANTSIRCFAIYGGVGMEPQIQALRDGVAVIAGTPGRILDHLRRGNFKPDQIKVLVIDECDEMLSMGFLEDLDAIIRQLPQTRQTILLSATLPPEIQKLSGQYLREPETLKLSSGHVSVEAIHHAYYLTSGSGKLRDLVTVLEEEDPDSAIIFCNTRDDTAMVAQALSEQRYSAEAISSDLSQKERERVMADMRAKQFRFLVATDIAARGIDIQDLSHVINYGFPESTEQYIHRSGRTGRAGRSGIALSLIGAQDLGNLHYLRAVHRIQFEERFLPSPQDLAAEREGKLYRALQSRYEGVRPDAAMTGLLRRIWASADGSELLSLVLAEIIGKTPQNLEKTTNTSALKRKRTRRSAEPPRRSKSERIVTKSGETEYYETRDEAPAPSTTESESNNVIRLYLNIGRAQGARSELLSQFICDTAELSANAFERIDVKDRCTFLNVATTDIATQVIERLKDKTFNNQRLRVEIARSRR